MRTTHLRALAGRWRAGFRLPPGAAANLIGLLLAIPVGLPLLYLLSLALQASPADLWQGLVRAQVGWLAWRMTLMATGATLWAVLVGAPWAWLVARTDVPGRRLFRWLGPLPLAVPPYVGALVYAMLLSRGGLLHRALADVRGLPIHRVDFPVLIYGPWGAAFVLGLFTAPYVFLNVYGALRRIDPALEEAARGLGHAPGRVFLRVTLPLLRPALLGGMLLVFVYTWVDFGVVSILRARTFTTLIFTSLLAGLSLPSAAGLSLVLVIIVLGLLAGQHRALGRARYVRARGQTRPAGRAVLGRWRWVGLAYLLVVAALTLALPLGLLLVQALRIGSPAALATFLLEQRSYVWNSLQVAAAGSLLALLLAGSIGWLHWRRAGFLASALLQTGYAVPGTVLGLVMVGVALDALPGLYGRPVPLLALTYAVLFAAPALQGVRAALAQIPPALEEAVRALGYGPLVAAIRVVVPLAWPGLAAAWLLAFVLALRELAATAILRPAGFDTLPVRLWVHATDVGLDPRASAIGLLLFLLTGVPWLLLLLVRQPGTQQEGAEVRG